MTEAELKRFAERNLEGRFPENELAAAVLAVIAERDVARREHAARCSELEALERSLAATIDEAATMQARVEALEKALEELMAWQNGPPLVTYTEGWTAAMKQARALLAAGKEGP